MTATVRVIASDRNWIESKAVDQLKQTGELPGMLAAVGMPDLHPGKGSPIGAAFACKQMIYPYLIGNDIGCGMTFWQTNLSKNKLKTDKWLRRLDSLEDIEPARALEYLSARGIGSGGFENSLGTVGGGNHFAELQKVQDVGNREKFAELNLDASQLMLLVHSGSRGLGERILRKHTDRFGAAGLHPESDDGKSYMEEHAHALKWANANRTFIGERFLSALSAEGRIILDLHHNFVEETTCQTDHVWLHRKGACPSNRGAVIIPGSRGALTYLVAPTGNQESNLHTLAHGAGRKWNRADCRGRLENKYSPESFLKTDLGSKVICSDKDLLYEEAPQAYKDIDVVVQDLLDENLVEVIATLAPIISYKTAR